MCLVPFLLDNIPEETCELLILVVLGIEHVETLVHDFLDVIKRDVHETPGAKDFEELLAQVTGYHFNESEDPPDGVLCAADFS